VAVAAYFTSVAFLWRNVVGVTVVVILGLLVSLAERPASLPSRSTA
jgi:hypothetical protein